MTASLRVVLGLLGLSLLALVVTGSPIYSRLSYLWGFLLAGSWLWAALALRGVQAQRRARTLRAQVGQIFQEQFEIRNVSRWPHLWLEVRDQSTLSGPRGSRVLILLGGRQQRSYRVRTRLVLRGVFPLGPTVLASGDPFGLFPVSRTLPLDGSLLVYPMTVEVRAFPSPPGLLPGGEALRRRTHQVTPNAAGVREYAPGDSLNRIHWVSTARRDCLMVKEFELDPLAEVWILPDAAREVQAALPYSLPDLAVDAPWHPLAEMVLPPSTEEYTVSIAASLGRYFLQRGRAVGLVSCGQPQSPSALSPDRGGRQLAKILEALALLRAEGDLPISALATAQAQHLSRGSTVILITPSVRERVALTVDHLLQRGLRPVVVLLDAVSFGGPPGTEVLANAITALGAPVCLVANGADLGTALSKAAGVAIRREQG
jgi:uncharacterized protein (DUF58 family)